MSNLINITNQEGNLVVNSRDIAKNFEKEHKHVLRDIDDIIFKFGITYSKNLFIEDYYTHPQNKQKYREYLLTKDGLKLYIDNSRKTKKLSLVMTIYNHMLELEGEGKLPIILTDRFEDSFFNDLEDALNELGVELDKQYHVSDYFIDGYLPEYKLAIEYDEEQHKYNVEEDMRRENEIAQELGCGFIRLDYKDTNGTNIGKVIAKIMEVGKDE